MIGLYLFIAFVLLAMNGFFVLAEFAAVKMRPSRVDALIAGGNSRAKLVKHVQTKLDDFLSVCQVGITFCTIGLGFVAATAVVKLIEPIVLWTGIAPDAFGTSITSHGIAFVIAYLLVSFLHILIGELVPKSMAIRITEPAALWTARPLIFFYWLFFPPLWVLMRSSNFILLLMGQGKTGHGDTHGEDELRLILARSHNAGVMSFRRLLFMENVFDLGELKVKDAMRPRGLVKMLRADRPWEENLQAIREARFTRYPLVDSGNKPLGIVHIKDLVLAASAPDLPRLARGFVGATEEASLEQLLTEMQRRRTHVALVTNRAGEWTGFITMEDIIEEIIGTIEDEFGAEMGGNLADAMSEPCVVLDLEATSIVEAIKTIVHHVPATSLPLNPDVIIQALSEREGMVSTYLGNGVAMPHARLPGLMRAVVIFARSPEGVAVAGRDDLAHIFFVLLTPAGQPRIHQRMQARIAGILDSDFIDLRLREVATAAEIMDVVRTGEQTALD